MVGRSGLDGLFVRLEFGKIEVLFLVGHMVAHVLSRNTEAVAIYWLLVRTFDLDFVVMLETKIRIEQVSNHKRVASMALSKEEALMITCNINTLIYTMPFQKRSYANFAVFRSCSADCLGLCLYISNDYRLTRSYVPAEETRMCSQSKQRIISKSKWARSIKWRRNKWQWRILGSYRGIGTDHVRDHLGLVPATTHGSGFNRGRAVCLLRTMLYLGPDIVSTRTTHVNPGCQCYLSDISHKKPSS